MLSLIIAPSGFGKTQTVITEIKNILNSSDGKKIYVIVPEQESVKMEAELLRECSNIINKSVEVLNFSRLANRVFREAGGMTYKYIDNCGKDLIVAVLLEKFKDVAPSFSSMSEDIKYIELLRSEMDTMRQKGIRPQDFEKVREALLNQDKGGESLGNKLTDFSFLMSSYEKALKDSSTDATDDIMRLSSTLDDYDFFEDSYVFIDGFYDYTFPQYEVIEKIIKSACKTTITFSMRLADAQGVFRKTRCAYDRIREIAEKNSIEYEKHELDTNIRIKNKSILSLAESIMNGDFERTEEAVTGVDVTSVSSPYDECVYVAREITKLLKEGSSHSDIAVVTSSLSEYGSMLENVFDAYDINYLSCTEISPVTHPIVSLVLNALDTVNSRFFYKNIKTYLKSPYLKLSDKEAYTLENYITLWQIKYKDWQSEKDWIFHPKGYVEEPSEEDKEELDLVNTARKKVYLPLKHLSDGLKSQLVEDKVRALVAFLEELEVFDSISDDDEERSAWNMLIKAFEELFSGAGDLKVSKDRFTKYLRLLLSNMSFGKIPSSLDEVEIGEVGFIRNKNIKHLFFIGFNDGNFPKLNEKKSIFTESEKKWLAENDMALDENQEEKMYDQLFLFLLAVLTPCETLHFVCHTSSGESSKAKALPSFFYSYIKDCLGVEITNFDFDESVPVTKKELEGYFLKNENGLETIEKEAPEFFREVKSIRSFLECKDKLFKIDDATAFIKNNYAMTQSRLEKFERCRFSYFVEYMLKARTRKTARFSNAEIGSYVHKILELVLRKFADEGRGIQKATVEEITSLVESVAGDYIMSVAPDIATDSPKYKYIIDNISAYVIFVIENIREEFASSLFKPTYFEESLGESENVKPYEVELSSGGKLVFYGIIDRVDTYVDENGVEYIRVVDYKTKSGGKSFSLEDVINGMNIQMLIYLFAMTATPSKHTRREAGIMYMPAGKSDLKPTDVEMDDDSVRELIDTDLKRSGMYLDDRRIIDAMESGENKRFVNLKYDKKTDTYSSNASSTLIQLEAFGLIERYINSLFDKVMTTLKEGDIEAKPLDEGSGRTSCDWCSFKSICRYEGDCKKRIKEKHPLEYMKNALDETTEP